MRSIRVVKKALAWSGQLGPTLPISAARTQAQREACEAFINSQRHEGWVCLPACYDDGGFSGATMDRPALQRLLPDIRRGGQLRLVAAN